MPNFWKNIDWDNVIDGWLSFGPVAMMLIGALLYFL